MFPLCTIYVWEALHPGNITPSSSAFLYSLFLVSFIHLSVLFFSSCFLPLSYSSCSPQPTFPLIEPCPRSELKSCLISRKFPMIFFNGNSTFKSVFLAAQTRREAGFAFSSPLDKCDGEKSHDYLTITSLPKQTGGQIKKISDLSSLVNKFHLPKEAFSDGCIPNICMTQALFS